MEPKFGPDLSQNDPRCPIWAQRAAGLLQLRDLQPFDFWGDAPCPSQLKLPPQQISSQSCSIIELLGPQCLLLGNHVVGNVGFSVIQCRSDQLPILKTVMNLGNRVGIQLDSHNYLGRGGWMALTQLEI